MSAVYKGTRSTHIHICIYIKENNVYYINGILTIIKSLCVQNLISFWLNLRKKQIPKLYTPNLYWWKNNISNTMNFLCINWFAANESQGNIMVNFSPSALLQKRPLKNVTNTCAGKVSFSATGLFTVLFCTLIITLSTFFSVTVYYTGLMYVCWHKLRPIIKLIDNHYRRECRII